MSDTVRTAWEKPGEATTLLASPNGHKNEEPIIRLSGVVKIYRTAAGDFTALKGVDLEVRRGEFLGIIGKSGSGKTTLINILTGVDHANQGEVWMNDLPIHKMDENQLAVWRGRNVGVIYQSFYLMPTLNLIQNVTLPMDMCGLYRGRASDERAMELLRMVELDHHARKLPSAISGGQQQRVAIARALANDPQIIVADEPTGRLDSATAETIFQIFTQLVEQHKTILMVTHDQGLARRTSRTLRIVDGEIDDQSVLDVEEEE
ncbi:MAG: ABC transporter ATP-binding protein [Chloroflexi bacterium]|nr:ABC transporter ATP-binding protein [Chloroflexota bacterium]